jgi:ribosome-associated protein
MTEAADPLFLARRIAALAQERRAADAVLLDVRALVDYTDFFLVVSGMSSRQNLAIAEHIVKTLKGEKRFAISKSGLDSGSWVCLDLGSVVVHVFDPETRVRYDLELLWADAPRIDPEGTESVPAPVPAGSSAAPVVSEPVAAAAPASFATPTDSDEAKPKRRRRTVRTAAVEDADAENAPDSERPPEDVEPAEEVPDPAPRRRKVKAAVEAPPPAAKPAKPVKPTKADADEAPAVPRRKSAAASAPKPSATASPKRKTAPPSPKKSFGPAPKLSSKYAPPRRPPKNRNK